MRDLLRTAFAPAALLATLLLPGVASAQDKTITIIAPSEHADAAEPDAAESDTADNVAEPPAASEAEPSLDDDAIAAALTVDPADFAKTPAKKSWRKADADPAAEWSRNGDPNGPSSISVKRKLPIAWDSKVGADLNLPGAPVTTYDPNKPLPGMIKEQRSGAAWANVTVPELATIEVRLAPSDEQRKVGTSVQRTLPLGQTFAMTVQGDVIVTENYPGIAPSASSTLPAIAPPQVWDNQRKVQFKILPTGTTLAVATNSSTLDNVTHHTLSAEQKIYGPLQVTTAVTDPGLPTASKSIAAGLKLNW
jgi:hypothetical protein